MDKKTYEELINKVIEWGKKREFVFKENAMAQVLKLVEECGELSDAFLKGGTEDIIDAIGDIQIVMILLCEMIDLDFKKIFNKGITLVTEEDLYPMIIVGEIAEGTLKKNEELVERNLINIICLLYEASTAIGIDVRVALQTSYDVIANRNGKVVDGSYIKEEDLNND